MQRVYNRDDNPLRDIDMVLDNPTAIYVTEAGALSKIGISTNPQARARDIQVGNGQIVRLAWYRWMNGNDARRLEHAVHKAHRGSTIHAHGEWYYLSTDSAIDLVVSTIDKMNLYSIWERYSAFVERSPADRIRRNLPNPGDGVFR